MQPWEACAWKESGRPPLSSGFVRYLGTRASPLTGSRGSDGCVGAMASRLSLPVALDLSSERAIELGEVRWFVVHGMDDRLALGRIEGDMNGSQAERSLDLLGHEGITVGPEARDEFWYVASFYRHASHIDVAPPPHAECFPRSRAAQTGLCESARHASDVLCVEKTTGAEETAVPPLVIDPAGRTLLSTAGLSLPWKFPLCVCGPLVQRPPG